MSFTPFTSKRRRSSPDSSVLGETDTLSKRTRSFSDSEVFESKETDMANVTTPQIIETLNSPTVLESLCKTLTTALMPHINATLDIKLKPLLETVSQNSSKIKILEETIETMNDSLLSKDSQIDELYQYGRRNNIRVYGMPENKDENTDNLVLELTTDLGLTLKVKDIDRSLRTGDPTKYSKAQPRPILVKFTSYRVKRQVMTNLAKLKNRTPKVFVNADLTKEKARLATEARQLVTQKRLAGTWARDGVIYVKKLDGSVVLITKRSQFTKLTKSLKLRIKSKLNQGPRETLEYTDADDSDND